MRRSVAIIALAVLLGGCLQPAEMPRLSDAELAEEPGSVGLIAPQEDETQKSGFLATVFGKPRQEAATPDTEATADENPPEAPGANAPGEPPREKRLALFGARKPPASQEPDVAPGTVLPFGQVASACGVRGRALGKEVDRFPAKGKGYRLYDTDPTTTAPRTHYLTGFSDGCARQFTASLALLGSPVLHEQVRYDRLNKDLAFSATDAAYEKIKARICRTGKGKPCPAARVPALEKSTGFVTLYERFGGNARWAEILVHDGKLVASDIKSR